MSDAWRGDGAARAAIAGPRGWLSPSTIEALERGDLSLDRAHVAWELVTRAGGSAAEVGLALLLELRLSAGSTRLDLDDAAAIEAAARLGLGADRDGARAIADVAAGWRTLLDDPRGLVGPSSGVTPLVVDGPHLYAHRIWASEVRLTHRLARLAAWRRDEDEVSRALAALEAAPSIGIELNPEQRGAVRLALASGLSVVRGAPGTGKTSVVVAILRAAVRAGIAPSQIGVAAPTGKAAQRVLHAIARSLDQILAPDDHDRALVLGLAEPRTLHRLLGYSPRRGRFHHHAHNRLAERLVLVDESSMVDVVLMEALVSALPEGAQLVLLGDADQLPSVDAGSVFRDLGECDEVPRVTLIRSHRVDPDRPEGLNILSVARAVHEGKREPLCAAVRKSASDPLRPVEPDRIARLDALEPGPLAGVFHHPGSLDAFLAWWRARTVLQSVRPVSLDERDVLDPWFDALERARLLAVTREPARSTGADALNAQLHRMSFGRGPARPGEPLSVQRNDYERALFNGDQGLLLDVRTDTGPRPMGVFRRVSGYVAHRYEAIEDRVTLGYASTVHRAQGSEHDEVALVLPTTDSPRLLTREVVYTAITRARRAVVIVGDLALFDRALTRTIERSSGVAERIRAARVHARA
ncbi:MAG: ATP-dependent RecD-like DNA helicase [Sandaracinaceae bacterium]